MTQDTTPASGAADLPEALRVPLDSLHADAGYLCGRLLNGSLTQEQVVESIRRRIDAAKLAALTAQAISAEPAEHVQNPAENEHVAGDVSGNGAGLNMSTPHARITELESQLAQRFDAAPAQPAAEASRFGSPELQAMIIARCVEKDQAESVYAFRRKGLEDFCTCDEARYEELSNKPHLFETRVFYTAPQPSPTAQADSGFDYKTAADFLSGKTVSDEALRKFVAASRGAHDARAALHAKMLSLQGELASREAEIALLKRSLLDAEADAAAPQPAPSAAAAEQQAGVAKEHVRLVRVIADKIEDGTLFQSGIYSNKDLARFVRNVADAAAPQTSPMAQAAPTNPHWDYLKRYWQMGFDGVSLDACTGDAPIKAWHEGKAARASATPAAQAAQADSVQEDAARLDYLHSMGSTLEMLPGEVDFYPMRFRVGGLRSAVSPNLREAIDIARKQGEKQ